jgi:hypothetical protein
MTTEGSLSSSIHSIGYYALPTLLSLAALFRRKRPEAEEAEPANTVHYLSLSDRFDGASGSSTFDPETFEKLRTLAQGLASIRLLQELESALLPFMEAVCRAMGSERAAIFLCDTERFVLRSYRGIGLDPASPLTMPMTAGIAGETIRLGTVVAANDIPSDARHFREADVLTGFKTTSILSAPLKDPFGMIFGVLEILNRPEGFASADQAVILPLASALSDALFPHLDAL